MRSLSSAISPSRSAVPSMDPVIDHDDLELLDVVLPECGPEHPPQQGPAVARGDDDGDLESGVALRHEVGQALRRSRKNARSVASSSPSRPLRTECVITQGPSAISSLGRIRLLLAMQKIRAGTADRVQLESAGSNEQRERDVLIEQRVPGTAPLQPALAPKGFAGGPRHDECSAVDVVAEFPAVRRRPLDRSRKRAVVLHVAAQDARVDAVVGRSSVGADPRATCHSRLRGISSRRARVVAEKFRPVTRASQSIFTHCSKS